MMAEHDAETGTASLRSAISGPTTQLPQPSDADYDFHAQLMKRLHNFATRPGIEHVHIGERHIIFLVLEKLEEKMGH